MIYFIQGIVQDTQDQALVVSVGGLGLHIAVPDGNAFQVGQHYHLSIYFHWSAEQGPQLFGFKESQERLAFMHIISCNGIGPKIGLALLKQMSAQLFFSAIIAQDFKALSSVNGIGSKKAEAIVLHLKDKVGKLLHQGMIETVSEHATILHDVSQALGSLNYTKPEIQRALDVVKNNISQQATFEELMRKALAALAQKRI